MNFKVELNMIKYPKDSFEKNLESGRLEAGWQKLLAKN